MNADLQQHFDHLVEQRAALLSRVEGLDDEALNRPPAEGKWSIIQVLSHLAVAEEASLAGVRKMTDDPARLGKTGLAGWARSTVLQLALRMPFKIKAPARAATVPERQDLETTRRQWDEVRVGWRETLEAFPDELLDRTIFMHPVVGPLSLTQGLRFMEDHLDRHAKQIDRIVGR